MSTILKTTIRIGRIRYVNSIPFYHQLAKREAVDQEAVFGGIEFYDAYPTAINLAMRKGKLDMAPISSLEYLNHQREYILLPGLAIGSRDFSGSVLLVSKERIEGLDKTKIAISRQSLSSAVLLRILLRYKYKFQNQFVSSNASPDDMLENHTAALIIGDDALFYQPKEFVYKYDLSELWWNWTGKPFCFALWAVRRDFAQEYRKKLAAFYPLFRKNLEDNLANLEKLLKDSLNLTFVDERFPKVFGYLFNLNYGFDSTMREGLELFYRLAQRLGVSPRLKQLDFFEIV